MWKHGGIKIEFTAGRYFVVGLLMLRRYKKSILMVFKLLDGIMVPTMSYYVTDVIQGYKKYSRSI